MSEPTINGGVHSARRHESAHLHVAGEATYTDDILEPRGTVHIGLGRSQRAHAKVKSFDFSDVLATPGVLGVFTGKDFPGVNCCGSVLPDEAFLSSETVEFYGQPMFAVAAENVHIARRAARKAKVEYEDLEPVFALDEAVAKQNFVLPTQHLKRGEPDAAIERAPHRLSGTFAVGGQEQFYLEGMIALAVPKEDGTFHIYSSTQNATETQHIVAHGLDRHMNDVVVECRRMGGGFGGKETQPAQYAGIAAMVAHHLKRPAKLRLDRDDDMVMTGKRHGFEYEYEVGFDDSGRILGVKMVHKAHCGFSADLSGPVADRAIFHSDNAYFLDNVEITSYRCKTNTVSNTAYRGFGGPQGVVVIEQVIDEIARYLGRDALEIRERNFYGVGERNVTPYQMVVEDNILPELVGELKASSDYARRRQEIDAFNARSPVLKKGLALTPVKFGISFTATFFNQAGALLHVYNDGSVVINHGGHEMGQGLNTKVAQVVAEEFQLDIERIRCTATDTSKVPNTSATAASSGSDLNGKAAQDAAQKVRGRLVAFAAERFGVRPEAVRFRKNHVHAGEHVVPFEKLVKDAYLARVQLWDSGFYRTPKIHYDFKTLSGRPFFYFAYGAAVSEVIVDTLTGENRIVRVDILHDVGRSLNPAIDLGQVEGAFIQGAGWLTTEELWWNDQGDLRTHAPSTYKIPTATDWPVEFDIRLMSNAINREDTIYRSKAVGEPPFMLGTSVLMAIRDAIASLGGPNCRPPLLAPATAESVLRAVTAVKAELAAKAERAEALA